MNWWNIIFEGFIMKKKKWNKILAVFWVIMTAISLLNAFNEDRKKGWNAVWMDFCPNQ